MSMLMQLDGVTEHGRLQPLSAQVNAGRSCTWSARTGQVKHIAVTYGRAEYRAGRHPVTGRVAFPVVLRVAGLPQGVPGAAANRAIRYAGLALSDAASVRQSAETLLEEVAAALGIEDKLPRHVSQLSGGEWQRVRLAAVILQIHPGGNPHGQLLLLDEPMNSLDVAQQVALDRLLSALSRQGIAVVMSSHDLNHTLRHAHRVWLG